MVSTVVDHLLILLLTSKDNYLSSILRNFVLFYAAKLMKNNNN